MNRIREKLAAFRRGRYGIDRLNLFLLVLVLIWAVCDILVDNPYYNVVSISWQVLLLVLFHYRMFSKNIIKRNAENQKFLAVENRIRRFFGRMRYNAQQRKDYHIYTCPYCRQKIRIPRGKGRISVRCPKCGGEFVKNS